MSRDEFMRELEYLIQDIPEEDKVDALGYYRDYMEEAGEEREEEVLREFGSPERIAAMIRADLAGHLSHGGEFTDRGYDDERFRDPNFQVAQRYDLPDISKLKEEKEEKRAGEGPRTSQSLKILLWIILAIVAIPTAITIGGGVFGLAAGLFGVLIGLIVALAALTFAFFAAGGALSIAGILNLAISPLVGMLLLGLGLLLLGLGCLFFVLCYQFYGKLLPFLLRGILDGCSNLLHRGRGKRI